MNKIIHGESNTRLYNIWECMKTRCYNKHHIKYHNYGGRGISICDSWKNSYINFRDWALMNGYNENLTIDRINVNGNYEPSNCQWITHAEQQKNRRTTKSKFDSRYTLPEIYELAKQNNISKSTVYMRLKRGWSLNKAISSPKKVNQWD